MRHFFLLGCTSFGGPAAHIGYFQKTFVEKLQWIDMSAYGRLVALSQFLPGPGSSQVGFALGLQRAGLLGGIAAFVGFTSPSFILLYCLAVFSASFSDNVFFNGVTHGLKLLAVVVVADAVLSMSRSFCKEWRSRLIAVATATVLLLFPGLWTQMLVLLVAAIAGCFCGRPAQGNLQQNNRPYVSWLPLIIFMLLFVGLPFFVHQSAAASLFPAFYQSGSLVFGGGHVVLPLLQQMLDGNISPDRFLTGYAAAQAVPGPMFSLAAFLGAELTPETALTGALIATAGIFLPGFLLVLGFQQAWQGLAANPRVAGAVWGVNAAVVGLLLAALYQPVFTSAVSGWIDVLLVIAGFIVLNRLKWPVLRVVVIFALTGVGRSLLIGL
ncbi:chromate efflux transporter [Endozoicomonadaceae bacterium StTr2]